MKPKLIDHVLLPIIGAMSAGIVAFLIGGVVGFNWVEVILPLLGGAAGHCMNQI